MAAFPSRSDSARLWWLFVAGLLRRFTLSASDSRWAEPSVDEVFLNQKSGTKPFSAASSRVLGPSSPSMERFCVKPGKPCGIIFDASSVGDDCSEANTRTGVAGS